MRLGAAYVKSQKAYKIPISKVVIQELMEEVENPERIKKLAKSIDNYYELCYNIKELKNIKTRYAKGERLREYQKVDVEFLKMRSASAVFNEQRTGKTPTALKAFDSAGKMDKAIIVCPSGLKLNWQRELETWCFRPSTVITGTPKQREKVYEAFKKAKHKVIIISYETLRQDISKLEGVEFTGLIVDEAHRLRNFKTLQSKALYKLRKTAANVLALTGTPAVNHPSDIFGILKLLRPSKYTSYWYFIERYFGYVETRYGRELLAIKKEREAELTEILYTVSVQRKRKDVMEWIPKVTERTIPLEVSSEQTKYINQIINEFRVEDMDIPNVITQLTRLRQVCLSPSLLVDGAKTSPKTQFLKEFVEDNDGSVLVFSSFTSYLKELKTVFPDAVLLTGEQSQAEKQAAVDAIQSGKAKIMLSNIIAGGVGWTLDRVDTIVFTDKSFNPVDNAQAQDRFVPTKQDEEYGAKQIITLIMKDTIENKVEEVLETKMNVIKFVNDYGLNELVNFDKKEHNNNASLCHL